MPLCGTKTCSPSLAVEVVSVLLVPMPSLLLLLLLLLPVLLLSLLPLPAGTLRLPSLLSFPCATPQLLHELMLLCCGWSAWVVGWSWGTGGVRRSRLCDGFDLAHVYALLVRLIGVPWSLRSQSMSVQEEQFV